MARPSTLLPGWSRVKGTERFLTPLGAEVSKRQYYNAKAAAAGGTSYSQLERARKQDSYGRLANLYANRTGRSLKEIMAPGSEFNRRYLLAVTDPSGKLLTTDQVSPLPGQPFSQLLEFIGARPQGATWNVGET